jgi:hypothetical protein
MQIDLSIEVGQIALSNLTEKAAPIDKVEPPTLEF